MSSHKDDDPKSKDIPDVVVDSVSQKRYIKGRFLGKVGLLTDYDAGTFKQRKMYASILLASIWLAAQCSLTWLLVLQSSHWSRIIEPS
jgi:hypothetical protein